MLLSPQAQYAFATNSKTFRHLVATTTRHRHLDLSHFAALWLLSCTLSLRHTHLEPSHFASIFIHGRSAPPQALARRLRLLSTEGNASALKAEAGEMKNNLSGECSYDGSGTLCWSRHTGGPCDEIFELRSRFGHCRHLQRWLWCSL